MFKGSLKPFDVCNGSPTQLALPRFENNPGETQERLKKFLEWSVNEKLIEVAKLAHTHVMPVGGFHMFYSNMSSGIATQSMCKIVIGGSTTKEVALEPP